MTRIRGVTPKKYIESGYCTKCGLWGQKQLCITYLSNQYYIISYLHVEYLYGYRFSKRCYAGVI